MIKTTKGFVNSLSGGCRLRFYFSMLSGSAGGGQPPERVQATAWGRKLESCISLLKGILNILTFGMKSNRFRFLETVCRSHMALNFKQGGTGNLRLIFRTMSARNYRLFFAGQTISLIGTWIQQVAMSWLVYRLTDSEFLLGLVGFLGLFPVFLVAPFAGVVADRFDRRCVLIATQVLAMLQALLLAFLVLSGLIRTHHVMILAAVLGLVNAFDNPVRQSFTVDMIEKKEDLSNAIALNSAMFNGARLVGPFIAGLVIAALGDGLCFLLNGLSYLAVIAALLLMKIKPLPRPERQQNVIQGIGEGFAYAFRFIPIRFVLLMMMVISIVGMPYLVLMPVFARDILHGGPQTLGFLTGSAGGGALLGAVYLASRKTVAGLESVLPGMTILFGLGLVCFAWSPHQWLSMLLLFFTGFGMMVQNASANTIIQTVVDDDKRGRVMSIFVMFFMGTVPFGSLLSGALAARIGAQATIFLGGICCLAAAGLFIRRLPVFRDIVRPVYVEKGVISEVALGLQAATNLPKPPTG